MREGSEAEASRAEHSQGKARASLAGEIKDALALPVRLSCRFVLSSGLKW